MFNIYLTEVKIDIPLLFFLKDAYLRFYALLRSLSGWYLKDANVCSFHTTPHLTQNIGEKRTKRKTQVVARREKECKLHSHDFVV